VIPPLLINIVITYTVKCIERNTNYSTSLHQFAVIKSCTPFRLAVWPQFCTFLFSFSSIVKCNFDAGIGVWYGTSFVSSYLPGIENNLNWNIVVLHIIIIIALANCCKIKFRWPIQMHMEIITGNTIFQINLLNSGSVIFCNYSVSEFRLTCFLVYPVTFFGIYVVHKIINGNIIRFSQT
jgi:hypothetical protein